MLKTLTIILTAATLLGGQVFAYSCGYDWGRGDFYAIEAYRGLPLMLDDNDTFHYTKDTAGYDLQRIDCGGKVTLAFDSARLYDILGVGSSFRTGYSLALTFAPEWVDTKLTSQCPPEGAMNCDVDLVSISGLDILNADFSMLADPEGIVLSDTTIWTLNGASKGEEITFTDSEGSTYSATFVGVMIVSQNSEDDYWYYYGDEPSYIKSRQLNEGEVALVVEQGYHTNNSEALDVMRLAGRGLKVTAAPVTPEPATATLSLLALAGLASRRRRH